MRSTEALPPLKTTGAPIGTPPMLNVTVAMPDAMSAVVPGAVTVAVIVAVLPKATVDGPDIATFTAALFRRNAPAADVASFRFSPSSTKVAVMSV